jgi:hypothetical protein
MKEVAALNLERNKEVSIFSSRFLGQNSAVLNEVKEIAEDIESKPINGNLKEVSQEVVSVFNLLVRVFSLL